MALGYMRRHKRWLYAFLWVVIAGFIVYFIPFFQGDPEDAPGRTLATVGSLKISVAEYQRERAAQRHRLAAMMQGQGRGMDTNYLRELVNRQALQKLADERVLNQEFERLGLRVDDETLVRHMQDDPRFQRNGHYVGTDELRRFAQQQELTLEDIEEDYRRELQLKSLSSLLTAGIDVTEAEVEQEYRERNERVKLEYAIVDASRFKAESTATDDEVRTRFDADKEKYRLPERRVVSYILLDREALRSRQAVTDVEIEKYYADHPDDFRTQPQLCASQIQINVK